MQNFILATFTTLGRAVREPFLTKFLLNKVKPGTETFTHTLTWHEQYYVCRPNFPVGSKKKVLNSVNSEL